MPSNMVQLLLIFHLVDCSLCIDSLDLVIDKMIKKLPFQRFGAKAVWSLYTRSISARVLNEKTTNNKVERRTREVLSIHVLRFITPPRETVPQLIILDKILHSQ